MHHTPGTTCGTANGPYIVLHRIAWALSFVLLLGSCIGTIGATDDSAGEGAPWNGPASQMPSPGQKPMEQPVAGRPPSEEASCRNPSTGGCLSRRLTRDEYDETVRDLLGDTSRPARLFSAEASNGGFTNDPSVQTASSKLVEEYASAAEQLALRAATNLPRLVPCDPKGEEVCARAFVESFGKLAFRRPLEGAERDKYVGLWRIGRQIDFTTGVRLVVTALLQSPNFLYRVEIRQLPPAGGLVARLTPWEIASRISYLVWGTMPDTDLFAAADSGRLSTYDGVLAEVRRMMANPRARVPIARFSREWFGLDNYGNITLPERFDKSIPDLMKKETAMLLDDLFSAPGRRFSELFTTNYTFVDAKLASYYGWTGPRTATFERVNVDPARGGGVLAQGGLMAATGEAAPIFRGLLVRAKLLCNDIPPPNPDLVTPALVEEIVRTDDSTLTTRQQFEPMVSDPRCTGCHSLMNPIGFAFENYDSFGRWRVSERGKRVDASGDMRRSDVPEPFSGVPGLVEQLRRSEQAPDCMAKSWFRFAYGRVPTDADACSLSTLRGRFKRSGYQLSELFAAAVETDAFWYRSVAGTKEGAMP